MIEQMIGIVLAAGLIITPYVAETEVIPAVELAREVGAYLGPEPDPDSDQYWQQVADSINFRFDTQLSPNCTILYFDLEPGAYYKNIRASISVPIDEFDTVFPESEFGDAEIDRFNSLAPGIIRFFDISEDNFLFYYWWAESAGEAPRDHRIVVCKESEDRVTVHFTAYMHTYLNSIEDLEQW